MSTKWLNSKLLSYQVYKMGKVLLENHNKLGVENAYLENS